ncbi:MAG TPA: hypothetical protein VJV78_45865 [Polyangiales bacterium]|nr:hypothetical protein [Polyangiales bacterium]
MITATAAQLGYWELLPCELPVLVVPGTLMHTGKIVFFAGSGNDELHKTGFRSAIYDDRDASIDLCLKRDLFGVNGPRSDASP